MENVIIIAIVAVILAAGIRSTVRHFKGQGGCCGDGGYRPRKKKLSKVLYRKTFQVDGMHCKHCKNRVEEAINDIRGVAGRINLRKGELTVSYAEDVSDELIKEKIERAGFLV